MDANDLRGRAVREVHATRWTPDFGEERIAKMIENRPDWCISRQRTWGVPIPLFIDRQSGELHPETLSLMRRIADIVEEHGVDPVQHCYRLVCFRSHVNRPSAPSPANQGFARACNITRMGWFGHAKG